MKFNFLEKYLQMQYVFYANQYLFLLCPRGDTSLINLKKSLLSRLSSKNTLTEYNSEINLKFSEALPDKELKKKVKAIFDKIYNE